jgi:hypothetical protein
VSYKLRTTIATAKRLRVAPHIEWKNDSKRRMQEEEMSDIFTHMLDDDAALLANMNEDDLKDIEMKKQALILQYSLEAEEEEEEDLNNDEITTRHFEEIRKRLEEDEDDEIDN